jgi:enoyl-CoA hydratase
MKIEIRERVALLAMNAGKANAIGPDWLERMEALLREFAASDAVALVLTGYEGFFSGGLDLPALAPLSRAQMMPFIDRFDAVMLGIFETSRPVVAAINGHAVAGGCVLALQADERLMADGPGKIGLNEVTLGVGLPVVVIESLRCQVPASALLPIALEAKLFPPREALALGLLQEVVPPGELVERALARARKLGELPAAAFAQVKAGIRGPVAASVRGARGAADRWLDTWFSAAAQERIGAAVARLSKKK